MADPWPTELRLDKDKRVRTAERLGLQDGEVINMDTRRTASYGQDKSFVESLISSL